MENELVEYLKTKVKFPIDSIRFNKEILQKQQADPCYTKRVKALAEDISKNGLQKPMEVLHLQDGEYLLVEGYHRFMACKLLGWKEIDCLIKESLKTTFIEAVKLKEKCEKS